jgi:hypothetical protein
MNSSRRAIRLWLLLSGDGAAKAPAATSTCTKTVEKSMADQPLIEVAAHGTYIAILDLMGELVLEDKL